jgi:hypothetical protein
MEGRISNHALIGHRTSTGDERRGASDSMTVLESLAILEAAVLECKKRNVNTPEVSAALDLLERYIYPKWLIPQFRNHVQRERNRNHGWELEGLQQVLRATFPRIRDCVRELLGVRMDALARKFHETHDMNVPDEIYRLAGEYGKLKEPWVFRP